MAEKKSKVRYLVTTPKNPEFAGKTLGIQFSDGKAVVEDAILPTHLNRSLDEVIAGFRAMGGYEVTVLE